MDLDIYTTEMAKSAWDKAFFMDKIISAKCVIDFGCADGAMIRYLSGLFPDIMFVGYDISHDLIMRARSLPPFNANLIYFHESAIEDMIGYIEGKVSPDELCINFSSVLHEVFSSTGGLPQIQYLIETLQPRYITIRDMYCDEPLPLVGDAHFKIIEGIQNDDKLDFYSHDFVKQYGTISDWRDMVHLLMKLQWIDNGWKEEMKEHYFSWTLDELLAALKHYIPAFECRYQLPYLSELWKKQYDFYNPDIHTHAQFILRRDDYND